MQKIKLFFWAIFLVIASCASPDESEAVLKQANDIHLEAIQLNKKVQPDLESMIQTKNQIKEKVEELSAEEEIFVKKVEQLEKSYAFWEENHVEVPGFEHHDHDHHDHDHSHNHGTTLEVSAEDMLLIQQEFKDSITLIFKRLEAITLPTTLQ